MTHLEDISEKLKAISDPTRLSIIKLLSNCHQKGCCNNMFCVNALAKKLGITQSAVSQHLKILRQAGFVQSERRGYFIHYKLLTDEIDNICKDLNSILK